VKCSSDNCTRDVSPSSAFGFCSVCAWERHDAYMEFSTVQHERNFPQVDVTIESDSDWRPHVVASSRLPKRVQVDPDGPAARKYMRDGRGAKSADLRALNVLDPFEVDGGDDTTAYISLADLAEELGVCVERARQIEIAALRKLRKRAAKFHLQEFYDP
jgi:hypothetical protein